MTRSPAASSVRGAGRVGSERLLPAYGAVLAGAALWGTTGTAQALAPAGAGSVSIGAFRALVGGAVLIAFAGMHGGVARRLTTPAVLVAGVSIASYQLCFFNGVRLAGVAVGTVVALGSVPVLTGLAQLVLRRRRPEAAWYPATALAVIGTILLVAPAVGSGVSNLSLGAVLAVGAGASYTCFTFASKHLLDRGWTPRDAMGYTFGLGGLLMAPLLLTSDIGWATTWRGILVVMWLGGIATAASYLLFARGLRRLEPPTVATLSLAEPLTATVLGLAILHERPGAVAVAGAVIIFSGLVMVGVAPLLASRRSAAASRRSGNATS